MPQKKIYNLKELEKKFKNEWILTEVLAENELNEPIKMRLIAHSKDRNRVYQTMMRVPDNTHVATLYTGSPLKEGYAAAF